MMYSITHRFLALNTRTSLWFVALALGLIYPAIAQSASGTIAQGYAVDKSQTITPGAIVSIQAGKNHQVELATPESSERLVGVVDDRPLVSISEKTSAAQVVLSGTTTVLVSDANGGIMAGDKIATSPLAGIGMKATLDNQVVGTAQASFMGQNAETRTVTDKAGKSQTVHVGRISIQVAVAYYRVPGSDFLPPFVQRLAYTVAGRPVSLARIIISTLLLLAGLTGFLVIISSSIRNSLVAIGRNPLAAVAIRKGFLQVGLIALTLLSGTLLAAYIILVA